MLVIIRLDVRKPLKRKKKMNRNDGTKFVVTCIQSTLFDWLVNILLKKKLRYVKKLNTYNLFKTSNLCI